MELGKKVAEFSVDRKISFDGECYHLRLPLEIMRLFQKRSVSMDKVGIEGIWDQGRKFLVVLMFDLERGGNPTDEATDDADSDDSDCVVLKG